MRILMVYNDYQQPGGEIVAFRNERDLLVERGHEVVAYERSNYEVDGMHPLQVSTGVIWNQSAYRDIRRLIRQHRIELMHVHNVHVVISPSVFHAAAAEGIPSVFTLHNFRLMCPAADLFRDGHICEDCVGKRFAIDGIVHKCYRNQRRTTAGVAAMQTIHRALGTWHNKVTRFIALTEFTRKKYIEGGLPADRLVVKANLLGHPPAYSWEPDTENPYALLVGRLAPGKGVQVLLDAWRRKHPGIGLKVVGSGDHADALRRKGQDIEGVEFLGRLERPVIFQLLRHASLFLMPSLYYECSPFALLEAQAVGTPAVVSAHGSLDIMVEHGVSGWHAPAGNARAWADTITDALSDPDRLATVSRAARAAYERESDRDTNYARLMEIYDDAIAHVRRVQSASTT